ncbi:MAG TPA: Ppx/GppA phosphatase family protein [Bryobacteraceae bacterium]|nr:Ppx/GppA phosphatase family protein [Bryobacteraceae bacterium]
MRRYAAVDIGSNSIRMLAAEISLRGITMPLAAERQVVRLGEGVFRSGRIGREAMDAAAATLARFGEIYRRHNVVAVRAVATSAVRDAGNQQEFLERASQALGANVEIISGQEEARLIHLGVQARWPQPGKRILIADVGGGSAELMLSENQALAVAFSKPLGAVRLTEVFLKSDPPAPLELHQMHKFIDEKLAAPVLRIGRSRFDRVIATSASAAAIVCAVNRVPRARRDDSDRLRASVSQIRKLYQQLSTTDVTGRRKMLGIGPRRAEIVVAGVAVFLRILETFQQPSLSYSSAGVRDGIIADLAARGAGSELLRLSRDQRKTVESMARRYGVALPHARQVARLGLHLFESLQHAHRLPPAHGKLLEAAAYLHDVGHFVSDSSHHKHSYYLVANSDMPGFTVPERRIVAALCRYHRKAAPTMRHPVFESFDADTRRAIVLLAPLLRLADSLDRSHDQRVAHLDVQWRNGTIALALSSPADMDLEIWAAERNFNLFREVYQMPITLVKAKP